MNLKSMKPLELDGKIKSLAAKERELLLEILQVIKEIDSRKIYLEFGHGSLFQYLTEGVGYSEGSAQRRIDAARLLKELPEISEEIKKGELKLNQISLLQKAARETQKIKSQKISKQEKLEILKKINQKNHFETQKEISQFFDLPIQTHTQKTVQRDESVRIEITLSLKEYQAFQQAQELISHQLLSKDPKEFINYTSQKIIEQKSKKFSKLMGKALDLEKVTQRNYVKPPDEQKISGKEEAVEIQRLDRQGSLDGEQNNSDKKAAHLQCSYVDLKTGKTCHSKWQLQIDHIAPKWSGNYDPLQVIHSPQNYQILCGAHNRMKYRKEVGISLK